MILVTPDDRSSQLLPLNGILPLDGLRVFCVGGFEAQIQPLIRQPLDLEIVDACVFLDLLDEAHKLLQINSETSQNLEIDIDASLKILGFLESNQELQIESEAHSLVFAEISQTITLQNSSTPFAFLQIMPTGQATLKLVSEAHTMLQLKPETLQSLALNNDAQITLIILDCDKK